MYIYWTSEDCDGQAILTLHLSVEQVILFPYFDHCMLFMLPRDCSASGMFAVHNVMSCPALVRKLVFGFYKRVKASQNSIVQAICAYDIW